jgi:DNA-binding transcriptional LysR family regulator
LLLRELGGTGSGIVSLARLRCCAGRGQRSAGAGAPGWATRRMSMCMIVFPSHKSLSPALRAFVDLAAERLGAALRKT